MRSNCSFCIAENSQKDIRTSMHCDKCKQTCCRKHSMKICNACVQNISENFTEKDAFTNDAQCMELELVWIKQNSWKYHMFTKITFFQWTYASYDQWFQRVVVTRFQRIFMVLTLEFRMYYRNGKFRDWKLLLESISDYLRPVKNVESFYLFY